MKTNYNELIKLFQRYDAEESLDVIDIYVGNVNGKYDHIYNIDKKEVLDTLLSDGNVYGSADSHEVDGASYTCIVRYVNDGESNAGKLEKVMLFLEKDLQKDFMFAMVQQDLELYQKIFDRKNYRGHISNFSDDNKKGLKIVPSCELIKLNKKNEKSRGAR